ncbi:MAG: hypothetical protein WCF65_08000 [Parachlamydiaceae bacterium]
MLLQACMEAREKLREAEKKLATAGICAYFLSDSENCKSSNHMLVNDLQFFEAGEKDAKARALTNFSRLRGSEKTLSQNIYERGVDQAGFGRIRCD